MSEGSGQHDYAENFDNFSDGIEEVPEVDSDGDETWRCECYGNHTFFKNHTLVGLVWTGVKIDWYEMADDHGLILSRRKYWYGYIEISAAVRAA